MKIVLPYIPEEFYSREGLELLSKLNLTEADPINHVLLDWVTYAHCAPDMMYEQTIDDIQQVLHDRFGFSDEGIRLEHALVEHSDQLVELMSMVALRLRELLSDYPDEHTRLAMGAADFHFLKVGHIDHRGRYLIITDDVIDG